MLKNEMKTLVSFLFNEFTKNNKQLEWNHVFTIKKSWSTLYPGISLRLFCATRSKREVLQYRGRNSDPSRYRPCQTLLIEVTVAVLCFKFYTRRDCANSFFGRNPLFFYKIMVDVKNCDVVIQWPYLAFFLGQYSDIYIGIFHIFLSLYWRSLPMIVWMFQLGTKYIYLEIYLSSLVSCFFLWINQIFSIWFFADRARFQGVTWIRISIGECSRNNTIENWVEYEIFKIFELMHEKK